MHYLRTHYTMQFCGLLLQIKRLCGAARYFLCFFSGVRSAIIALMKHLLLLSAVLLLCSGAHAQSLEEERIAPLVTARPIVVELYTSQGCASCPAADEFLGELVNRSDVLPISFHVDYWDYIGWKDPFAIPGSTKRQKVYNKGFGIGSLYTPQMVIDGVTPTVGSHRNAVLKSIEKLKFNAPSLPMQTSVDRERNELVLRVAGVDDGIQVDALPQYLDIWMIPFNRGFSTPIDAGENRGKELRNYNIARKLVLIGKWNQRSNYFRVKLDTMREDGVAFIAQAENQGRIMGATVFYQR